MVTTSTPGAPNNGAHGTYLTLPKPALTPLRREQRTRRAIRIVIVCTCKDSVPI